MMSRLDMAMSPQDFDKIVLQAVAVFSLMGCLDRTRQCVHKNLAGIFLQPMAVLRDNTVGRWNIDA